MKIFVDTAKLSEIKEALSWSIVGVTINPSLIRTAVEEERVNPPIIEKDSFRVLV